MLWTLAKRDLGSWYPRSVLHPARGRARAVGAARECKVMSNAGTPGGLLVLRRQKAIVYQSLSRVLEAENDGDSSRVEECVEETRRHLAEGGRLFEEHLAQTPGEAETVGVLAREFYELRRSYATILDEIVKHARDRRTVRAPQ